MLVYRRVARLDDAFSEVFKLEASPVEGQSLQQKETEEKERKRKGKKKIKKIEMPNGVGHFLLQKLNSAHVRAQMS